MKEMSASDWKKGWIGSQGPMGLPENIRGTNYNGFNSFFLQLITAAKGYRAPIFMTMKQANELDARISRGEKAIPVLYWNIIVKDKDGKNVPKEVYDNMSYSEKLEMTTFPVLRNFYVFNIDQSNLREVNPIMYQKLLDKFKIPELRDVEGMYVHSAMDSLIKENKWVCPINADKPSDKAFYSLTRDAIVVPMKKQFNKGGTTEEIYMAGQEFYGTLIHEMAHSTMTPDRCNRDGKANKWGDEKYAKEELVAELTSALIGNTIGFDPKIRDNNAAYLSAWIKTLGEEPKFITTVMSDVNKSSEFILERIDAQRIALGETPYLAKNKTGQQIEKSPELDYAGISVSKYGKPFIRASYMGVKLPIKDVSNEVMNNFRCLNSEEKQYFLTSTVNKLYKSEIDQIVSRNNTISPSKSMKP